MKRRNENGAAPDGRTIDGRARYLPDLAALLVFFALGALLAVSVRYGVQNGDETNYIAGANHFLLGDRMLVDFWSLLQLFDLFLCIPLKLCLSVLGGTEGVVLAMRYVYVGIKLIFFCFIYLSLRKYRYWAILCAVIFTAFHPMGFFTLTYYTIAPCAALLIGMILFLKPRRTAFDCVFCGVVFACCVLAEPFTALVYFGYTLLVLAAFLRGKKGKPFPDPEKVLRPRVWGLLTAGILLTAAVFFLYLLAGGDAAALKENLTALFSGSFFDSNVGTQTNVLKKVTLYLDQMGYGPNIAALLLLAALCFGRKRLRSFRLPLFAAACAVFVWMTAAAFLKNGLLASAIYLTDYKPVPLCFLGLSSYLLTEQKDTRLFRFFVFGAGVSLGTDAFSSVSLGAAAVCVAPVCVLMFRQALLETAAERKAAPQTEARKDKKPAEKKAWLRTLLLVPAVCGLCALVFSEGIYCFYARRYQLPEATFSEPLTAELDRGPLKGLITLPMVKDKYDTILRDMDAVREAAPQSLFVMGDCEWCSLYLNVRNATYSTEPFETPATRETLPLFWSLHPEKRPDLIYIPYADCNYYFDQPEIPAEKLSYIRTLCDCDVTEGEAGYMVRVLRWRAE